MAYTTSGDEESTIDQFDGDLGEAIEPAQRRFDSGKNPVDNDEDTSDTADAEHEVGEFLDDVFDAGLEEGADGQPERQEP